MHSRRRSQPSSARYPKVELRSPAGQPDADLRAGGRRRGRHGRRHGDRSRSTPSWSRCPSTSGTACVVVPPKHPAPEERPLTLEKLAEHPIVTYDFAFANRSLVQKAFESRGLKPHVVLSAQDSDVIKTYVELGLGVGILAKMAFDPKRDLQPARHRRRATSSSRAPRAWASSAAPTCGATPTSSSSCSRRSCRAAWSSKPVVGAAGLALRA